MKVLAALVVLMFAALTTRLWFLQVLASPGFSKEARDNSLRTVGDLIVSVATSFDSQGARLNFSFTKITGSASRSASTATSRRRRGRPRSPTYTPEDLSTSPRRCSARSSGTRSCTYSYQPVPGRRVRAGRRCTSRSGRSRRSSKGSRSIEQERPELPPRACWARTSWMGPRARYKLAEIRRAPVFARLRPFGPGRAGQASKPTYERCGFEGEPGGAVPRQLRRRGPP